MEEIPADESDTDSFGDFEDDAFSVDSADLGDYDIIVTLSTTTSLQVRVFLFSFQLLLLYDTIVYQKQFL